LSYNNLLDVDAAVNLIAELKHDLTFAILKHNNACGLATRTLAKPMLALACDQHLLFWSFNFKYNN
jgi:phosphoribosylaminoimidazolecarboxamide formyltransferase/IMP cyclohydrolase